MGDPDDVSAICVNRGGKIYAQGTPIKPIIMTSGFSPGNRDRGDWGGLLVMGNATTNLTEAAIEGGIADDQSLKKNGWYGRWNGVNNDEDSSGVISYVRIEFAGIAESPDNELNGLTMGAVGRKTVIDHVQVSYGGDDAFEWFGGTVNAKNLIAYNTIDDDFDTDNGFSGKVQFGLVKRFKDIADQSNSEAFESDNDSKSSENLPVTRPVFSNITAIGPVQDTSWTPGTGDNKYNSKFLTGAQIRRNSRMSLYNSLMVGWPAGIELTGNNTVRAADADSMKVKYTQFYGVKNNKWFYFGSGTNPQGDVDAGWLANSAHENQLLNGAGNTGDLAKLNNAFPLALSDFNPAPKSDAPYLSTAKFTDEGNIPLNDPFFEKVSFRGAFGSTRWDLPWAEYDPVNKTYAPTLVDNKLLIKSPKANDQIRVGRTTKISWDTMDTYGYRTWNKTFEFKWSENQNGPWSYLVLPKNTKEFKDVDSKNAAKAAGAVTTVLPRKDAVYIKMQLKSDTTLFDIVGPVYIISPAPATPDSTITGSITGTVTLSPKKLYGLKKVVYVENESVLRIEPGTVIMGDPDDVSAICINRGGKIYAKGTFDKPIVMTSGYSPGNRDRGDWGGLLIMGNATTNLEEAAIEGGIADDQTVKKNGWYGKWNGVNNDDDSSGVLSYVRIEFAGIAESPDNELNGLTMGAVGRKTVIDNVQVSYGGDDAFEWFGGTVNAKHLIAYNTIDDDFDSDNGFSGKVQFGLIKRFTDIADQSNSEAFESDNDSKASENLPVTKPVFSNITVIGPVQDTSWTPGTGSGKYNSKFLTGAQIRRNSRMSLFNSLFVGWPAGVEMTDNNTVRAADGGYLKFKYNEFYGIRNNKWFYFGSNTAPYGQVDANWLQKPEHENNFTNGSGNSGDLAKIVNAYPNLLTELNPLPKNDAPYLSTAKFTDEGQVPLNDPFFEKVQYRGAFGTSRWDVPWAEYDPINKVYSAISQEENKLVLKNPKDNDQIRAGRTTILSWDTLDTYGNRTWDKTFEFKWSESPDGPWGLLVLPKNAKEFKDVDPKNAAKAIGATTTVLPRKNTLYIKIQLKSDTTLFDINGPISVITPSPATPDSTIQGSIAGTVTLSSSKLYGLKKVVYVEDGGVLRIEPGTKIFGDPNDVSAICVNRGGKIYAKGTETHPIVMTSGYSTGNRDRGDWGGLLIMGNATTNLVEAAIEGGIADDQSVKKNGWYGKWNGVNNDDDSSGVISYVRIEFAGIAESPDNELNGLTLGAVGRKTVIDHVQVSYGGDDAFEWFGGTVNAKNLIAYNTIDDDFDTDNGFSGKIQYGIVKRFKDIADQSNSEAFESDNDSKASENSPYTRPIFSNITVIGPVQDTSWTPGTGDNKYNSKYLTAVQVRRNSRMSLFNSVIIGWPAGVELTNQNTVRAANADSLKIRYNNFYGVKNNKWFYFGSGTTGEGNVDATWLSKSEYGNVFTNGSGNTADLAHIENGFTNVLAMFNPAAKSDADYLNTSKWDVDGINDDYFDKVSYRGAMDMNRWDLPWAEYDPVNVNYMPVGVEDDVLTAITMNVTISPLPAVDFTVVKYYLPSTSDMTIRLIDGIGNINSVFIENVEQISGFYEFTLNTENLASGIYYLQFVTPKGIQTEKVLINK
jgi:hypothetical protein